MAEPFSTEGAEAFSNKTGTAVDSGRERCFSAEETGEMDDGEEDLE